MRYILFVFGLVCAVRAQAELPDQQVKLRYLTEHFPPYQMLNTDGSISGLLVDVVKLLQQEASLIADIEIQPWPRAYKTALKHKNTIIFSMQRNPQREHLFKWIGEIYHTKTYFIALNSQSKIKMYSTKDARNYVTGVVRGDYTQEYMHSMGLSEHASAALNSESLWKMLIKGRIDMLISNPVTAVYELKKRGVASNNISYIYPIDTMSEKIYIAANINTPAGIINKLSSALEKIKQDGRYQAILKKWLTI